VPQKPISKSEGKGHFRGMNMYNYMIFNTSEKIMYRDFLSYYKCDETDDLYVVSVDNPKLVQYLEEFLERRIN
jgi:hypothetical protein